MIHNEFDLFTEISSFNITVIHVKIRNTDLLEVNEHHNNKDLTFSRKFFFN